MHDISIALTLTSVSSCSHAKELVENINCRKPLITPGKLLSNAQIHLHFLSVIIVKARKTIMSVVDWIIYN